MQMDQKEEEPNSLLWGLDPVFSAFARLYIKDILQMKESCQVPGTYFYKCHPIMKVDILGTVVYKREREDFFCYGVDDGTGVINCLCWKDEKWRVSSESANIRPEMQAPRRAGFNPVEHLKKLKQAQNLRSQLDIGDLLRVRGAVKTSRHQREIRAYSYYKVNDPVMTVQISWMMEVPRLYRNCYDKPYVFQDLTTTDGDSGLSSLPLITRASQILKEFLRRETPEKFRLKDVHHILLPLISCALPSTSSQKASFVPQSSSSQVDRIFQGAIKTLQDKGLVFRRVLSRDEVYQVTEQDKELRRVTKNTIINDCRREKYAEKGCHVLHILSSVRQSYSQNVSRPVMEMVLRSLECDSEIISVTENHYTVL